MKKLRQELEFHLRLTSAEAKLAASAMVCYFSHKLFLGEPVDLGFMRLHPKRVAAREFRINFPGRNERYLQGETITWKVAVHESWQREQRPTWSKYCAK